MNNCKKREEVTSRNITHVMVWVSEQGFFIVFGLVVATHSGTTRSVELNNDKGSAPPPPPPPPRLLLFTPPCGQHRAVFGALILICEAEDSPQHKYAARNHFFNAALLSLLLSVCSDTAQDKADSL